MISAYRKYAPFTADKLIDAANAILGASELPAISKRTLRFYTAQGVVPRPLGSPKFARYGYEHLLTILTARALQDQGNKLHQIKQECEDIRRGQFTRFEKLVEDWLTSAGRIVPGVREMIPAETTPDKITAEEFGTGVPTRSIAVTPNCTVLINSKAQVKKELLAAREAIDGILKQIG